MYGSNDGFHSQLVARGGSVDRTDHPLMPQPLSRSNNYPSVSSNQAGQQPPSLLAQNFKPLPANLQGNSSTNVPPVYPSQQSQNNQYGRPQMPVGAMTNKNQPANPSFPSLMSGVAKSFPNSGNNNQFSFPHSPQSLPGQSNNNHAPYQTHPHHPPFPKTAGSNDGNMKPKRT